MGNQESNQNFNDEIQKQVTQEYQQYMKRNNIPHTKPPTVPSNQIKKPIQVTNNGFTPYNDKKIGEFYEPITLRICSKLGLEYNLPKLDK